MLPQIRLGLSGVPSKTQCVHNYIVTTFWCSVNFNRDRETMQKWLGLRPNQSFLKYRTAESAPGGVSLSLQLKAVHHDRLVDFAVGVVAADVAEDEDAAVAGLDGVGIVGRAGEVEGLPTTAHRT